MCILVHTFTAGLIGLPRLLYVCIPMISMKIL
jgi:hypothetical protein